MNGSSSSVKRIVILGGGFGGVYTAMYLENLLRRRDDVEIVLVNKENYFVFQPMLAEIVSGNIGLFDTVNPIRRLLPRTKLYIREVEHIDLEQQTVTLTPGFRPRPLTLHFDHLVMALGTVTDFRDIPGLHEHALPFKYLADAVRLRNHLIHVMQEAAIETDPQLREELLTFVVAGGGFSGVEVAAQMNDFLRDIAREYGIKRQDIRVMLVHAGERILEREVPERLGLYAQKHLVKRGLELMLNRRLKTATPDSAVLADGSRIPTKTLVSTVPSSPNPLIETLPLPTDRGKIKIDQFFEIEGFPNVSSLGDCCLMPNPTGEGFCPPTAQHAIRQAKVLAHNIVSKLYGGERQRFTFKGLGKMGSLGHRSAVALLFDKFRVKGVLAWMMWRTVYWWKLPGFTRKMKVGLSWILDLMFRPETVQLNLGSSKAISQLHFEPGEAIFRQGDLGDSLYIILEGEADVIVEQNGSERTVARLKAGEYFGEMALLKQKTRTATVRCATPMSLLALGQGDFQALVANLPDLQKSFQGVMETRTQANLSLQGGMETTEATIPSPAASDTA
ncbi:MAG TPA: FAD-dependent oxidoreductase [Planctomycetaceae bacterium]|nr:FAD-dependent oxidoreductase [Planctomycetaceae bacterium]